MIGEEVARDNAIIDINAVVVNAISKIEVYEKNQKHYEKEVENEKCNCSFWNKT